MAINKAEAWGLGAAIIAHLALFILLSFSFLHWEDPRFANPPMQVDIIAETAPVSTSPAPDSEAPAARLGEPDSRTIDTPPPVPAPVPPKMVTPPRPEPTPKVERPRPRPEPVQERPRPRPDPVTRPPERPRERTTPQPNRPTAASPARPNSRPTPTTASGQGRATRPANDPRPTGALDGIAAGVARDAQRNARGTAAPATASAAQVVADIRVSINGEVRAPWNNCRVSGLDVDQLRTTIVFRLTEAGGLDRISRLTTSGVNDSNRPQVARFEECARRAIEVAAPFNLPREHYSYWQEYTLEFEKR
jgi:outer membrane biosynthesis protein TonB